MSVVLAAVLCGLFGALVNVVGGAAMDWFKNRRAGRGVK